MPSETTLLVSAERVRRARADRLLKRAVAMLAQSVSGKKRTITSAATLNGVVCGIRERRLLAAFRWMPRSEADVQRVPVALCMLAIASSLKDSMSESLAVVRRAGSLELESSAGASHAGKIELASGNLPSDDVALNAAVIYLKRVGPVVDRCLDGAVDQMLDVSKPARETDAFHIVAARRKWITDVASGFLRLAEPSRLSRDARQPNVLSRVLAGRMIASTILEAVSQEIDSSFRCARFAPQPMRRALFFTLKKSGTERAVCRAHAAVVEILNELDTALYALAPKIWALAKQETSSAEDRNTVFY